MGFFRMFGTEPKPSAPLAYLQFHAEMLDLFINAKVLHILLSRHTSPLSNLSRFHAVGVGFGQAAAGPMAVIVCALWRNPAPPGPVVTVGSRAAMGDTDPKCTLDGGNHSGGSVLLSDRGSSGVSYAVIEPRPTPVSTENFPQGSNKSKFFGQNGLRLYCNSCGLSFRRIFACGGTCDWGKLDNFVRHTTAWGTQKVTPNNFGVNSSGKPVAGRGGFPASYTADSATLHGYVHGGCPAMTGIATFCERKPA